MIIGADTCLPPSESNSFGKKHEQDVLCDASGGSFALTFDGAETSSINFDAQPADIESALEEISSISDVDVSFPAGVTQACEPAQAGGFKVTFVDVVNYRGDVPEMASNIDNLEVRTVVSRQTPKDDAYSFVRARQRYCSFRITPRTPVRWTIIVRTIRFSQ